MRCLLALLMLGLLLGCEKLKPAATPTKPSLYATSSGEKIDAAREAGRQFGGTKP